MASLVDPSDHGPVRGRIGRFGRTATAGVPVLLVLALLPGCSTDPDSLGTTLVAAVGASVEHADGSRSDATDGLELRRGDVVRTGPAGLAELATGGRRLLLAASTAVRVDSGTREQLQRGAALVDSRRGPRLRLGVGATTVTTPRGGVVRVERSAAVRVGVFAGRATVTTAAGRSLDVDALHQVQAAGRTLPDRPSPLTLVGDAWERRVAPALVATDGLLRALATGLDADPAIRPVVAARSPAERPSERVLPAAIAEASATARPATAVRSDRNAGGSWGVVAALAAAEGGEVGRALDDLLAALEGDGAIVDDRTPGAGPGGVGSPGTDGAGPAGPGDEPDEAAPSGRPRPRPTPTPSSSPTEEPDLVEQAVAAVESLLPVPVPTVTHPAVPLVPALSPALG